jgi:hypothetical protein
MPSYGTLQPADLVRTDVAEEHTASIITVTIGELGNTLRSVCWLLVTANVIPSSPILVTLMMDVLHNS